MPAWCNGSHAALRTQSCSAGWGFKSLRGYHGPVVQWLRCRSFKPENAGRNRARLLDSGMHAGMAQAVERAVEAREVLIRSQVPAPTTFPRSSTDRSSALRTRRVGVQIPPRVPRLNDVGRMQRVIVGKAGSNP